MPGFWVSPVDPRVTPGFATSLSPAPTKVSYPTEPLGERVPTADGGLVVQQPARDNRVRSWVWVGYPGFLTAYEHQFQFLQSLRSRYRQESGASPYVWVKDDVTGLLRVRNQRLVTLSAADATTATFGGGVLTPEDAGGTIEVVPAAPLGGSGTGAYQIRTIQSVAGAVATVRGGWDTAPVGAKVILTGWKSDWYRARVVEVERELRPEGGNVRYESTTFAFVIDDPAFNGLG